jgi:hypothetical protein
MLLRPKNLSHIATLCAAKQAAAANRQSCRIIMAASEQLLKKGSTDAKADAKGRVRHPGVVSRLVVGSGKVIVRIR